MTKSPKVYDWLKSIQRLCYPPRCLLCGGEGVLGRDLCAGCYADLPHNPVACSRCALPLVVHEAGLCGACLKKPPAYDSSIIPFRYAPPLDHLLLGLKFHQQLPNARLLGGLLAEAVTARGGPLPEAILPVPLHNTRLRERGYNQALELARPVARALMLPLLVGPVVRSRATEAQSSLEKKARRRNIKGAFSVRGVVPEHVAIVDDVVTTGSTVNELAKVLRRVGVKRVEVWACARVE